MKRQPAIFAPPRLPLRAAELGAAAGKAVLLTLLLYGTAGAQAGSMLDEVERLADRGEVQEARQALMRWQSDHGESAPLEQRARGWFLSGRLADDAPSAELEYLRVIIEGSTTRYADDALLRLAQYKHAQGEYARAIEYLGRLRRDFPTSEHAAAGLLWISKAARALGDIERACDAAEQGLRELSPADTALEQALVEERGTCRTAPRDYTVQVAALKDEVAAQRLARELLSKGFDAWILNATPEDPLYRVRVGRNLAEGEAQALMGRLSGAGYSAFLVSQSRRVGGTGGAS